jgi:hypothetical protein
LRLGILHPLNKSQGRFFLGTGDCTIYSWLRHVLHNNIMYMTPDVRPQHPSCLATEVGSEFGASLG